MKKMNFILIIWIFNFSFVLAQENQNKFYVINITGTNVYEHPTFQSKLLTKLNVGQTIEAIQIIQTEETQRVGNGLEFSGNWIKTKSDEVVGYVFSSDLSTKTPLITTGKHGTRINLLGPIIRQTSKTEQIKKDNGTFPKYFETKYYQNGTYYYTIWDGCFNHKTEYKNLRLSEVYHHMISEYSGYSSYDKKYWIPEPISVEKNLIKFSEIGATQDLQIEIKENGVIVVSSYDCT